MSDEGQGSLFTLYLPNLSNNNINSLQSPSKSISENNEHQELFTSLLLDQGENKEIMASHDHNPLKGKKVLIVDDDMRNIFALTALLERKDMIVGFAGNGKDAISVISSNKDVDIVLMDIMMPEIDGYTAIKKIREIAEFKSLPVIALTAQGMKNGREKSLEAGASDYIQKPINIEELFSLMQRLL